MYGYAFRRGEAGIFEATALKVKGFPETNCLRKPSGFRMWLKEPLTRV